MSKNHTKPPAMFEPYSNWKLLIELWSESTDYTANQQGPILVLNLTGDARDAALSIPKDQLKSDEGVSKILQKLDTLYEKDETQLAFLAFDTFVKYRRTHTMDIHEFLRKFELMKNKCATYKFVIPENILAYFMLSCANLPDDKCDIIRATIKDFTVDDMRGQILKVYTELTGTAVSSSSTSSGSNSKVIVKSEFDNTTLPVMYADHEEYDDTHKQVYYAKRGGKRRGRGRNQKNYQGNYSSNQYYNAGKSQDKSFKLNPPDETGCPSQCYRCRSVFHWEDDCPVPKHFASGKGNQQPGQGKSSFHEPL